MPTQTLLWTVLPDGIDAEDGTLRLSVLMSPRLEPDGKPQELQTFRDFTDAGQGQWIRVLRDARFVFSYGSESVELRGADASPRIDVGDDATWDAMFRPDTLVRDRTFRDRTGTTVVSFDTVAAHGMLQQVYRDTCGSSGELPTVESLLANPTLRSVVDTVERSDRLTRNETTGRRRIDDLFEWYARDRFKGNDPAEMLLNRFQLFHTPPSAPDTQTYTAAQVGDGDPRLAAEWQTYKPVDMPSAAALAKQFDFHDIVSAMQQYPRLLRRLGLVIDFNLDPRAFTPAADRLLRVDVTLPTAAAGVTRRNISAQTHARVARGVFAPVSTPNGGAAQRFSVDRGLLRPDERLFVLQADVDGGMHKLINFARTLARKKQKIDQVDPVTKHPVRAGLPGIRNGGISLVHRGRGETLERVFERAKTTNTTAMAPGAGPELWWEDLVLGFRADVWDRTTARWRSLCERDSQYLLDGGAVTLADVREESTIRMAATSAADGNRPNVVYLHETIFTWAGWSLAARAPIRAVDKDDKVPEADAEPEVPAGMRLTTHFAAAPGTLPRLRYGRWYALRARVVDLAGNSLAPQADDYADEKPEDRARAYLRFDPVPAPNLALVRRGATIDAPREGESMDLLAIRTFNEVFDDPTLTTQHAQRQGVPQRTNVREAELHGMLDAGGTVDPSLYAMLVAQDRELDATILDLPGPLGTQSSKASYAVLDEGAALPYLPDPLSEVLAARFLHHPRIGAATVIDVPLYNAGKWPKAEPFLIDVYESATDAPRYDAGSHTLLVPLAKAGRTTLRLSSRLSVDALKKLGVWEWLADPSLAGLAREGKLWALTPWRDVEIVHAVQRPLKLPDITTLQLDRQRGATFVMPSLTAICSIASTARVDLRAAWNEPRDASVAGGANVAKTDTATTVKITDPVTYAASHTNVPAASLPGQAEHAIVAPDLIAIGPAKHRAPPRLHEFGDTRYRRIEYWFDATTRFREFLRTDVLTVTIDGVRLPTEKGIMVTGARTRTWVPSSAPPPAPKVLYVVPTFEWVRSTDAAGKQSSMRRGGGIRVYLDRPWNESGYGEMLAVVLLPTAGVTPVANDAPYKSIVTQWGNDPAWKSAFLPGQSPTRSDFPLARTAADPTGAWLPGFAPAEEADQPTGPFMVTNLTVPGAGATPVDIAPHDVFYDTERELWYADIEISPRASYFPFVRLALARYQPVSVGGCHLSNVVLADFMALTPTRWLSVTPTVTPVSHLVSVFGQTHSENSGWRENMVDGMSVRNPFTGQVNIVTPSGIAPTNVIELWLERLDSDLGDDLGWSRVPTQVSLSAPGGALPLPPPVRPVPGRPRPIVIEQPAPSFAKPLSQRESRRADTLLAQRDFTTVLSEGLLERAFQLQPLWSGTVTLSENPVSGGRYRLVIAEYEEYLVDDATPYERPVTAKDRRLVFVEHVELG